VTAGKQEYDLTAFFQCPLRDVDALEYRHDVMRELQDPAVLERIRSFAAALRTMRSHLATAKKLHYKEQSDAWFVDAVEIYCRAVASLAEDLNGLRLSSHGFRLFRQYVNRYVESDRFATLKVETDRLKQALAEIRCCLLIEDSRILVCRYEGEPDYAAEVAASFARFAQGAPKSYLVDFPDYAEMNHVEAAILSRVARRYPLAFAELTAYCERHSGYCDQKIASFDREVQFYIAYLECILPLQRAELKFCYPRLSTTSKAVHAYDTFDLALAAQLVRDHKRVVCNDLYLEDKERIFVVSGPNQGGKTTFARTFGQLHYLASLGLPVPGRRAQLLLCDNIFTHFEKEENVRDLRGKLEDDLLRIHDILARATGDSVLILNEIFTSTTLHDAVLLSKRILERIIELDALGVCVTFIDELPSLGEQTVSMVSTVVPEDPAQRTYKVVRRPADGLAYAMTIAEQYRVTYDCLKERVPT
jgi:DNA mismatch repair protein MutS